MQLFKTYLFILSVVANFVLQAQKNAVILGKVTNKTTNVPLQYVVVQIQNSTYVTSTSKNGNFIISLPQKKHFSISFKLLGYQSFVKELEFDSNTDTVFVSVSLSEVYKQIDTLTVYAKPKPDTIVGAASYSIFDFDFYEDKFILLTAEKTLNKAQVKLADANGKILTSYFVPKDAGEAKEFFRDYMGYTNLICKNYIYRISIYHDRFLLTQLNIDDVNAFIKPIIDTINGKIIFTDYWKDYPMFNYYSYNPTDSTKKQLISIEDKELMHAYNFEYYALPPKQKLEARRIAMDLKTDKHVIASLMSGFTRSMFYEPLYSPLYIIKDTICVFDHYKDKLYHLDKNGQKIDSISINYNHPKNWKEWKNKMLKDDIENLIYAVYDKNGHKYIKQISTKTGKPLGKYTLQFHSADKLKIHNGYAYYIYRPYESTQEKFFYRELIRLDNTN